MKLGMNTMTKRPRELHTSKLSTMQIVLVCGVGAALVQFPYINTTKKRYNLSNLPVFQISLDSFPFDFIKMSKQG
jgi:hypothetical protein